jgi:hypothetical protein
MAQWQNEVDRLLDEIEGHIKAIKGYINQSKIHPNEPATAETDEQPECARGRTVPTPLHQAYKERMAEVAVRTFEASRHSICYVCMKEITGDENAMDDHFRQEHPIDELPSVRFPLKFPKKSDGDSKPPNLDLSYDGPSTPDDDLTDAWVEESSKLSDPIPQTDQTAEIHEDRRKFADNSEGNHS